MQTNLTLSPLDSELPFVTLSDGRTGLRSGLQVEISEPSADPVSLSHPLGASDSQPSTLHSQPILDFIASDETLDRCDEVIQAGGWRLDAYQRNPVFQNAHQYGDIIFTLGKALITEVHYRTPREAPGALSPRNSPPAAAPYLFQRVQFATEANPMARIAYALYKGKFLNAVSVGFIPLRWANADGAEHHIDRGVLKTPDHPLPSDGRGIEGEGCLSFRTPHSELRTQKPRRRYLEQELLEVSAVGIPANPNALQLALKSGAIEKADLRDLLELLETVLNSSISRRRSRRAEPDGQSLLTLARDVWAVLRA